MTELELRIDPEFQKKIPPLTDEEFEQLRENILSDGEVYEPIIVWEVTIIDGHNRWRIVQDHPEIPYRIRKMEFIDKWAAFDWMYKKQLGRRNLSNEQRIDLIGRMYEDRKKGIGEHKGNQYTQMECGQNGHIPFDENKPRTAEKMAEELGIGARTIRRAEKFAHGIDAIREVSDEAASKILRGGSGVNRKTVLDFPKMEHDEKVKLTDAIVTGTLKDDAKEPKAKSKPKVQKSASKASEAESEAPEIDEEPKTVWDPVSHKRIDPLIERINADARDLTRVHEYTLDDMLEEMRAISEDHRSQLHRVLVIRSTLLNNAEAREAVFAFIAESVAALEELKQLVRPIVA